MSSWNKKLITKTQIDLLQKKYGIDALTASILIRRGITDGKDLLYYMEDDLRFQHSPFSFINMEDAVDRINDAAEENEKVLIFGDRDVDGITSTTLLYKCLKEMGIDVQYRLPKGDEAYGLSMAAVEDFQKENGSLIITVDCGISNNSEVSYAADCGIDVIIVDHHNPQENIPEPAIIINPKCSDSGYPFKEISGCAVVFKLITALRFSKSKWYKQPVTLFNTTIEESGEYKIECIKLRNLVPQSRITEVIIPGEKDFYSTKLPNYLEGELILVWDINKQQEYVTNCFGSSVQFNMLDVRPLVSSIIPSFEKLPLSTIKTMSKIAKYGNHEPTESGGFYNIYVTYVQMALKKTFPELKNKESEDLQLVALAALADIMPMKNENRIFVRQALSSLNSGNIRPGLLELLSNLNMLEKKVSSVDLGWTVVSNLNATGRLGQPELATNLFISNDTSERENNAKKIIECNNERKQMSQDAQGYSIIQAKTSLQKYNNKMCVVIDERINRGVTGIIAAKLASQYNVPAMVVTFVNNETAVGSIRSRRGVDVSKFLNDMGNIFINHGGHTGAGGFSFQRSRLNEFEKIVENLSAQLELDDSTDDNIFIDAEIPISYLTPDLLDVVDKFEPFGEENKELTFMTKDVLVTDARLLGKGEKQHLKLELSTGKFKWPALFWSQGERLHRDFEVNDRIDILYNVERNFFNGTEIPQIILVDLRKSQ